MLSSASILSQLLFGAPSIILAALAVAVVVRAIRDLIVASGREGLLGRVLRVVTDPVVRPVRALAPRIVPTGVIYLFAVCWLTAVRMLWVIASAALGVRSSFGV
jgi:uncharacterized protein YggT (Ycf19 family)